MSSDAVARLAEFVRTHLPHSLQEVLWVPAIAVLVFVVVTAGLRLAFPVVVGATYWLQDIVVAALLLLEIALALPFRIIRRQPPAAVYALGDGLVPLQDCSRSAITSMLPLGRRYVHGSLLPLLVSFLLVGWWNAHTCTSSEPGRACQHPVQAWASQISSFTRSVFD